MAGETIADAFVRLQLANPEQLKTQTATAVESAGVAAGPKAGKAAAAGFSSNFRKGLVKENEQTAESWSANLGSSLGKATAKLGKYSALALVGVGAASIKMAADFQKGLTSLVTGAGETEDNLGKISAGVKRIAVQSGSSTKDLINGLYLIESAGFHGADGLKVLQAAAEGAKVGEADLGTVADATTTVLKDYKLGGDSATAATNALIATVAAGKTHLGDLSSALARVLPNAAALGIGVGQVGGAIATMTSEGTSARLAAMGLNAVLLAVAAPSATAAKSVHALGGTSQDLANTLQHKGLIAALQMVSDLALKAGPRGSAAYVQAMKAMLGGANGLRVGLQLTGSHMQTLQQNTDSVSKSFDRGGKAVHGWALVQKDSAFQFDKFKSTLEVIAIDLGEHLLPVLESAVGWLVKSHLVVPLVTAALVIMTGALIAMAAAWALTPMGEIVIALGLITAAVLWLHSNWTRVWHDIRMITAAAVDTILQLFGDILHAAVDMFGWVPGIGGKLHAAEDAFDRFRQRVTRSIEGISGHTVTVGVLLSTSTGHASLPGQGGTRRAARGGLIQGPGGPTSDTAGLFALSNREFVMRAAAVDKYGVGFMEAMNAGRLANGGLVVRTQTPSASAITDSLGGGVQRLAQQAMQAGLIAGMSGGVGGGVGRWANIILLALSMLGQSSSWLGVVERRMNQESGGNPDVVNKWDSNWIAGHPSVGLMQVIAGTFARWAGPFRNYGPYEYGVSTNPLANTYAGLNYALHTYGSLAALSRPGGYANGGPITEPMLALGLHSGKAIMMGEAGYEEVTSQKGLALLAGLLQRLITAVYDNADLTAGGLASVLGGAARSSAYQSAYSAR